MNELKPLIFASAIIVLLSTFPSAQAGVPFQRFQNLLLGIGDQGLYNSSDKVISLTNDSFKPLVLWKNYSIFLEFYNSYCGHCRRFAPDYKQLALNLWPWRDVIKVMAIDCSDDNNNGICREYEVMGYPTLRYFHRNFEGNGKGESVRSQDIEELRTKIASFVSKENVSNSDEDHWPNFNYVTDKSKKDFIENIPKDIDVAIIIFEDENSTLAAQITLDFYRFPGVQIRRVIDPEIAQIFDLSAEKKIVSIDRNSNIEFISANKSHDFYHKAIQTYLKGKNIKQKEDEIAISETKTNILNISDKSTELVIKKVLSEPGTIYQADLEQSLRYTLFHEIPKFNNVSGEMLTALQNYLYVLRKYSPLGINGPKFIEGLYQYVMSQKDEVRGSEFEEKAKMLEKEYSPVFSSSRYVGCAPSKPGLRGFTCGLWQLFHFMTTLAADDDQSSDPLEVLNAMHGYVKYFFGCSDCSNHFQVMATQRKIWNTTSKDSAVLWLWAAHNEVNSRLSGDATEDPEFPKIQFPSNDVCNECYKESKHMAFSDEPNWDKLEVINFLKRIYAPENLSYYEVDNESILVPTVSKMRLKRNIENMFSDMDMRMGILLYGFCIIMMVAAVKLFLKKGYRKKVYTQGLLGRV